MNETDKYFTKEWYEKTRNLPQERLLTLACAMFGVLEAKGWEKEDFERLFDRLEETYTKETE